MTYEYNESTYHSSSGKTLFLSQKLFHGGYVCFKDNVAVMSMIKIKK
jgi:hypothetical protein